MTKPKKFVISKHTQAAAQRTLNVLMTEGVDHNQGVWFDPSGEVQSEAHNLIDNEIAITRSRLSGSGNVCGTTMCAAGAAVVSDESISPRSVYLDGWVVAGRRSLGLDEGFARWLFLYTKDDVAWAALTYLSEGNSRGVYRVWSGKPTRWYHKYTDKFLK